MTNEHDERKRMKDKLEFYFLEELPCHITLFKKMSNGSNMFLNGILVSKFNEDGYWLQENKLGRVRVFITEVQDVTDREVLHDY